MKPFLALILPFLVTLVQAYPWIAEPRAVSHFTQRHMSLVSLSKAHTGDEEIIFIGDSIMENWMYNGREVWGNNYLSRHAYNYGVSGDRVENVLWRVENGEMDNVKAKVVVLMVGSNNRQDKPADIVKGLQTLNLSIQRKIPSIKILLLSILPRGQDNNQVHDTNRLLASEDNQKSVFYLDLTPAFELINSPGHINASLFDVDQVHLRKYGYQIWCDKMEPLLVKLLA